MQQMLFGIILLLIQLAGLICMAVGYLNTYPKDNTKGTWKKGDVLYFAVGLIIFVEASLMLVVH